MTAARDFKKFYSKKWLKKLFDDVVRFKTAHGIDNVNSITFARELSSNIEIIQRKVFSGSYKFSQYREKLISRGPERLPRVISIPTIRDKLVQKSLSEILKSSYSVQLPLLHSIINDVISIYHKGSFDSFLRVDVKDFYPSIVHSILIKEIGKKVRKKEIINLISGSISQKTVSHPSKGDKTCCNKGVPQGLSISNILANIYLIPIDKKYNLNPNLKYFRYVDDILIFCNEIDTEKIYNELHEDCSKIGLILHEKDAENSSKTSSGKLADGFSYLGYEFVGRNITVRKKSIDNFRMSIISILTNYKHSRNKDIDQLLWVLNLRITGCIFNKSKYGWLFFFSQINDLSLLGSLDHFVGSQLARFGLADVAPKSMLRTYHEMTKNLNHSTYIPNFDKFPVSEKKRILTEVFKVKNVPSDPQEILLQFNKRIYKLVSDLERDLGRVS